ncbi:hypothetical protein F4556_006968 [Kitasatospora gansuensis]|uniref:Uncharacterized protein n=1 Tax=Kitasatospora gansuensis TaxID=258050 RepID=A0A7W7WLN0_9ACTN|nr:hypothetical protein [Kitasatospora gansuensis]MBB4951433.1 hypothetical protein [Kitasatospora gansuensis]
MTDPSQQLLNALDALDAAFAPHSEQPFTVGGCTYCYSDTDLEVLAGPADQVPADLISAVAAEATDHWDDFPALYRRMTPRIVRLLATGRVHVDHGLVASRLLAADWRAWTAPEQETLERVWHAWWRSALHEYPGSERVTGVLETISVSTGSLTPWLAVWAETRTEAADRHLSDALDHWLFERRLADLRFGFYNELDATPELLPWLLSLEESRIGAAQLFEVERIAY